jgi:hypothetical protein
MGQLRMRMLKTELTALIQNPALLLHQLAHINLRAKAV